MFSATEVILLHLICTIAPNLYYLAKPAMLQRRLHRPTPWRKTAKLENFDWGKRSVGKKNRLGKNRLDKNRLEKILWNKNRLEEFVWKKTFKKNRLDKTIV